MFHFSNILLISFLYEIEKRPYNYDQTAVISHHILKATVDQSTSTELPLVISYSPSTTPRQSPGCAYDQNRPFSRPPSLAKILRFPGLFRPF